jgi:hypothetical protein
MSAKNWSPDPIGAAVISFEWIVQGFTALSFWIAPNRSSSGLEDRLWCQGRGPNTRTGPMESV